MMKKISSDFVLCCLIFDLTIRMSRHLLTLQIIDYQNIILGGCTFTFQIIDNQNGMFLYFSDN